MWQPAAAGSSSRKRKPKANTIRLSGAFAGNEEEWTRRVEEESVQPERGVTGLKGSGRGEGSS